MSSITDFLFEGRPPQSVTTYGQTIENVPKWMSDYTQGLIARANAAAAEPFIPYEGPRIAGFSPTQQAAFGLAEQNVGAYQPFLERGAQAVTGGLEAFGRERDPMGAAEPYLSGAAETFPEAVGRYMDPYVENVLGRQESLATRTLEEEFLPRLQRTFAGAGQLGSRGGFGSMEDIGVRGVRDIQEGLEEQRLATLSNAYGQAGQLFGADAARQADLARTAGGLEEAAGRMDVQRGLGALQGADALTRMGGEASRLGMADAATLEAIGRQEQGLDQRSMDLAFGDYREQRDLPFERLGFMSDIIRGLPTSRAVQTTQQGPADVYGPSGLSQILGAYQTMQGFAAKGGRIPDDMKFAEGGLARASVIDLTTDDYEVIDG